MNILLAVDLKTENTKLLALAEEWSVKLQGVVDLLYIDEMAIPLPEVADATIQSQLLAHWQRERIEREAALQLLLERLPVAARGKTRMTSGSPAKKILELAPGYSLVMVGTHGRTGFSHLWLGSVAERVIRTCPVAVLVLRLEHTAD